MKEVGKRRRKLIWGEVSWSDASGTIVVDSWKRTSEAPTRTGRIYCGDTSDGGEEAALVTCG